MYGPAAEGAAEIGVVDDDVVGFVVDGFGSGRPCTEGVLGTRPDLADAVVEPSGAVHRLHGGVGEVGNLVVGLESSGRGGESRFAIPPVHFHVADIVDFRLRERTVELGKDADLVDRLAPVGEPLDCQGGQAPVGVPVAIGHDRDRVAQVDDAFDTGKLQCRVVIHGGDPTAEHGTTAHRGGFQIREQGVDAERRTAIDLVGNILAPHGCPDQRERL